MSTNLNKTHPSVVSVIINSQLAIGEAETLMDKMYLKLFDVIILGFPICYFF